MKTIVVTPFDSANFGAFLQAYCLKTHLESQGHEVAHIRTRSADYVQSLFFHQKPTGKREKLIPGEFEKQKAFGMEKFCLFTEAQACFHDVDRIQDADAVIVGSDEIWNVRKDAFRAPVFWGKDAIPTISYAASIGDASLEDFETCPDQIQQLNRFKAVLVRDDNTAGFVKHYTDISPVKVCDPTMLVLVNTYGEELEDAFVRENRCLLIYAYRLKKDTIRAIREYAKSQGLKTVACCFRHDWCDYQCSCGPLQFSSLIRQCEAVLTTTFHGTIFSILNHSNFVCIPKSVKTNQLLEQFGLLNRAINTTDVNREAIGKLLSEEIGYEAVDGLIAQWRESSVAALEAALQKCTEETAVYDPLICFHKDCTGCFACSQVCPQNAITICEDAQGRTLPQIDMNLCIKCGACKRVCPQHTPLELRKPMECYAAQRIDKERMAGSSSGGIGAVLAETFIAEGNAVVGSVVADGCVKHCVITQSAELEKLKGSKYAQSDMSGCYADIRACLKRDQKVLFVGTPCQVAAVRKVFGTREGLYCVDLVCHGVPPQKYLREHVSHVSGLEKADDIRFRGAPVDFVLKVFSGEKVIYQKHKSEDDYYYAFLKSVSYRENCYHCPYAQENRVGDLTIGDFWKINRETLTQPLSGKISLVLVNTEKGAELFEQIRDQLCFETRELCEAVNGNTQLRRPSAKHRSREAFLRRYIRMGNFNAAFEGTGAGKELDRLRVKVKLFKLLTPVRWVVKKLK